MKRTWRQSQQRHRCGHAMLGIITSNLEIEASGITAMALVSLQQGLFR